MDDEIDKETWEAAREIEKVDSSRVSETASPRGPRISSAVERLMRVYGGDFMRAFEALENATDLLNKGAVAQAATWARRASVCLKDPATENDRGRAPLEIVTEILQAFPSGKTLNWQGYVIFDEDCIREIEVRLQCSRERALMLLHAWHGTASPAQLEPPQKAIYEPVKAPELDAGKEEQPDE